MQHACTCSNHIQTNQTVCGEAALCWMLDTYKFFEVLQYLVKNEALLQVSSRVATQLEKIVLDKELLQSLVPLSRYASSRGLLEKGSEAEMDQERRVAQAKLALKGELWDVFVLCEPHVVSGMCCLLRNLCLAFPEAMATECHRHAIIVQLTRLAGRLLLLSLSLLLLLLL